MKTMIIRRYGGPEVFEPGEERLAQMIEQGKVRPIVEKTYSWNELAEAHRRVEGNHVGGKVAVVPTGGAA
jgi:NADPH:quinone reductase-like Zn-dependent oxidoreductase